MVEGEEAKVSKYNSGINIIMRLDDLWRKVNHFASLGKYASWNSALDRIWCELARDLKEDEYKDKINKENIKTEGYKSQFDKFDKEIVAIGVFGDHASDTFNKITPEQITNRNKMYTKLMEKELFLRRLENHLGKGTAWDDNDDDGFD